MEKTVRELLKGNVVENLMAVSKELNDGENMLEVGTYYQDGIFEDSDFEEVIEEVELFYVGNEEVSEETRDNIKSKLNFVDEEIQFAIYNNEDEDLYVIIPYVNIQNRFDETYPKETISFFNEVIIKEDYKEEKQGRLREEIKDFLMNDDDELFNVVRGLNSCDNSFEELNYWSNDEEFFNTYYSDNPMEIARAITYGEYNYSDEYVKINAHGNLESANEWEIVEDMQDNIEEIIDKLIEKYDYLYIHSDLEELLEAYTNLL